MTDDPFEIPEICCRTETEEERVAKERWKGDMKTGRRLTMPRAVVRANREKEKDNEDTTELNTAGN